LLIKGSKSTCPKNKALQQYLSKPSSSKTFFGFSPDSTRFLNCSYKCPIGFPQLKQRIGIIILVS